TIFRAIVRNIGWRITALAIGDASMRAGEMTHLHLPRAVVAGIFMDENNWRPDARFFVIKPCTIPCGDVRHRDLRYSARLFARKRKRSKVALALEPRDAQDHGWSDHEGEVSMSSLSRRGLAALTVAFTIAAVGTASVPAHAQQKPVIRVSSLTLPVFNPLVWNIMKARGFDTKNGFELDAKAYPSISAFYAAFATGETDVLIGGPTILQKLYQEGVPVRIIGTGFTLADLVIFTKSVKLTPLPNLTTNPLPPDLPP